MLSEARNFAADLESGFNPRWLSFVGSSGAGKTFLADKLYRFACTVGHLKRHDRLTSPWAVLSYAWPDVVDKLFNDKWLVDYLSIANFVFLDDVGAGYDKSGWQAERLYRIVNARVGRWTVLTSNLSPGQIAERMDPRISSRMNRGGSKVLQVDVPDFNLRSQL